MLEWPRHFWETGLGHRYFGPGDTSAGSLQTPVLDHLLENLDLVSLGAAVIPSPKAFARRNRRRELRSRTLGRGGIRVDRLAGHIAPSLSVTARGQRLGSTFVRSRARGYGWRRVWAGVGREEIKKPRCQEEQASNEIFHRNCCIHSSLPVLLFHFIYQTAVYQTAIQHASVRNRA